MTHKVFTRGEHFWFCIPRTSPLHFEIVRSFLPSFYCCAIVLASIPNIAKSNPLFEDESILKAVLTAPLTQAYNQRKDEVRLYMPGQWTYVGPDGATERLEVSIRTRGKFRRTQCRLPPLRLNFKKSQTKGTLFDGQDKMKLVSPCKAGKTYQQKLILEYLAYQALALVTEYSYRTRLVRLSYNDSDRKKKPWTHLTFVIEDEKDMAKRVGLKALRVPSAEPYQLDLARTAVVEIFQLFVANTDFSTIRGPEGSDCCHNVELLAPKDSDRGYVPVPYDFDASGLVDADYAMPPEKLPIRDVRKRYFMGRCKPREHWDEAIELFRSKRGAITALFAESAELNEKYRKSSVKYIGDFYKVLDDPKRVDREIVGRCRGKST